MEYTHFSCFFFLRGGKLVNRLAYKKHCFRSVCVVVVIYLNSVVMLVIWTLWCNGAHQWLRYCAVHHFYAEGRNHFSCLALLHMVKNLLEIDSNLFCMLFWEVLMCRISVPDWELVFGRSVAFVHRIWYRNHDVVDCLQAFSSKWSVFHLYNVYNSNISVFRYFVYKTNFLLSVKHLLLHCGLFIIQFTLLCASLISSLQHVLQCNCRFC